MCGVRVRCALLLVIIAASGQSLARQTATTVQNFRIYVDEPAYTGLPVWVHAELSPPEEVRYPYHEDPAAFGPNRLEVKRHSHLLTPAPFKPWFATGGILDGSIAPPTSPVNRLPLHLQYSLDQPGTYSVRWTKVRHLFENGQITEIVVARSDWLDFEVRQSTQEQRRSWLKRQLANTPKDSGRLVGDFLPSLLAAAPDPRVLRVFLEQSYSADQLVRSCVLGSLRFFGQEDTRAQTLALLHNRGPNEALAYLVSWREPLFHDAKEELVRATLPYLHSREDWQIAATLKMLGFVVHPGNFRWPENSEIPNQSDRAVLAAAPELIGRGPQVAQLLAEYLGGIKSDGARDYLWQVASRPDSAHEQALIALTWIADPRDLPHLGKLLLRPGDPDSYGRDLASLPHALTHAYGNHAIPYLERAVVESPYPFVRTQSAEELATQEHPAVFRFFLDALENDRFYKQELITWLKDRFPNELSPSADDAAVIAFCKARLP